MADAERAAVRTAPQVVRSASRGAPREPASAVYQPPSRGRAPCWAACGRLACSVVPVGGQRDARRVRRRAPPPRGRPSRCECARSSLARAASTSAMPSSSSCSAVTSDGRAAHRVDARLVLRERDHVAQVRLAGEHHRHPVDPERDPAHRRRAHRERVEQEAELRPLLLGPRAPSRSKTCAWSSGSWILKLPPPSSFPFTIRS